MNKDIMNGNFKELILRSEKNYFDQITKIADDVVMRGDIKVVLIAGPSCAGKTTSSGKLVEKLNERGKKATLVSLDDFYNPEIHKKAKPDLESVYSLDLEVVQECIFRLTKGAVAKIPRFDFKLRDRVGYTPLQLGSDDICVIEGLHALNPIIFSDHIKADNVTDVYLDCDGTNTFLGKDYRLLRRMVRDHYHRNFTAERTFYVWDDVRRGEKIYIDPYIPEADYIVKTFLPYEPHVLSPLAIELLEGVSRETKYFSYAQGLIEKLSEIVPGIPIDEVPKSSLLQEFLPD